MDFGFTSEQEQLREQVRRWLEKELPLDRILAWSADPKPLDRALWSGVAALGVPGITVPEAHGGLGLGYVDAIVVLEEMGKRLAPLPVLANEAAAAAIVALGSDAQRAALLPPITEGKTIATIAVLEASDVVAPDAIATRATSDGADVVLDGTKL